MGEEDFNLALRRRRRVRTVYEILTMSDREVPANGSGRGLLRVGGAHETAHDLPRVGGTFDDGHQHGTLRDELDELVVVVLALVLGVVALGGREIECAQFGRDEMKLLRFEATDDLADEASLDAVGLHDEERSVHDEAI